MLERRARPEQIARAVALLRDAGVQSLNLDLIFGVPGQGLGDLRADLDDLLALEPNHVSSYELEAKPGTRFTHRYGRELERQAEAMEVYYEEVVARMRAAGYRWYETANFCRPGHECRHNLGYWLGHDYLGVGVGAVSTVGLERRRNRPGVRGYLAAVEAGDHPPAEVELLTPAERGTERLMLGLRLDTPLELNGLAVLVDDGACARLAAAGMLDRARRLDGPHGPRPVPRQRRRRERAAMSPRLPLTPRQILILTRVVDAYIAAGHPIGSKTLVELGAVDASASTVRYELAELEARGFLDHPHTSAGRVPTDAGYRLYAESLLEQPLAAAVLPVDLSNVRSEVDTALRVTTEMLSQVTSLVALVTAPPLETTEIRHIEVIAAPAPGRDGRRDHGDGRGHEADLPVPGCRRSEARRVGERLPERAAHRRPARRPDARDARFDEPGLSTRERAFLDALSARVHGLVDAAEQQLYVGGGARLVEEMHFADLAEINDLVRVLEGRVGMLEMLREALDSQRPYLRIGADHTVPYMRGLAMVAANYGLATRNLGTVSLIGPRRMDYAVAIQSVRGAAHALSEFVAEIYEE